MARETWSSRGESGARGGTSSPGSGTVGYAYTAREWDPEIDLYYYRARYYDPKVGMFISEDPIGLKSADINFYGYVYNNPTSLVDPAGLHGISPWGAAFYCERHRQRNFFNRCPVNEPKDNPYWKQDFWGSKYRAPDGSECAYECGKLKPDENNNYTYNYEPDPFVHNWVPIPSPRHLFYDVLPHLICGPIVPGQTKRY